MEKKFIPSFLPDLGKEEIEEVVDTLKSGWISTGPKTQNFEELFSQYIGCKHSIAVSSCTDALLISLAALGIGRGDEVITSPLTFVSTANVVLHLAAKPVFVDIDPKTYNIDPSKIENKITKRTKAIVPVHYAGQPCDMDPITKIAESRKLKVIEDAAHAVGAEYKEKNIGTIGHTTCFSFYATKNLTTAEGGMITTGDRDLAEKMMMLRLHGISKDAWKRYSKSGSWYYEVIRPGYKANMTDIQASIGIHQLAKLEKSIKTRSKYAKIYNEAFKKVPELVTPHLMDNIRHAWHLYPLQVKFDDLKINRNDFIEKLKEKQIGTSVHFIPVPMHPCYKRLGYKLGNFPKTEEFYNQEVTLPMYPRMTKEDIVYVRDTVVDIVKRNRR
jgi:dTDP-4-amino-4,6-dideoxygalactose transaminase